MKPKTRIQLVKTDAPNRPQVKDLRPEGLEIIMLTAGRILVYIHHPPRPAQDLKLKARGWKYAHLLDHQPETDGDGYSELIQDRLTGGDLITYRAWNYSRSHGSTGEYVRLLGKRYEPETAPRLIAWMIKAILK